MHYKSLMVLAFAYLKKHTLTTLHCLRVEMPNPRGPSFGLLLGQLLRNLHRDAELARCCKKTKCRSVIMHSNVRKMIELNNKLQVASYMIAHSCQEDDSVST